MQRAIAHAGWQQPTPVQQRVIPAALEGRDLLVSAATGSGKTGAFLLPILQRLSEEPAPDGGIRALVLVPTRELAHQSQAEFLALGRRTRLTAAVIIGGEGRGRQVSALRKNPDLVIATPGRLREHLETGEADLSELGYLVLDEADRMLDLGFAVDVLAIIGASNPGRQSLLLSASLRHGGLRPITDRLLNAPQVIEVDPIRAPHPDIRHQLILSDDLPHKQTQLRWLLEQEDYEKALVFTNTRARAEAVADGLSAAQVRAAALHGEFDQRERRRVTGLFERDAIRVLVASDVAARGLDLIGVERVINLDVPRSGTDYLHRSGRTGRAGRAGVAITLVSGPEWNKMDAILRWLDITPELRQIAGLEARFQGPNRSARRAKKASSKSNGQRPPAQDAKAKAKQRPKQRERDRKNIGKRRQSSNQSSNQTNNQTNNQDTETIEAGFTPPRRRHRGH
ncbi:DEAD/DEAH box helicase [Halochromatium glycolicum]|uniref:DEAD/DEAH box helicase n=1 Tax=Halochromatium glycolicum TaxID=85075 RepID=UPI001F5B70C3|nr:DEAD/DEAH box helicase [Halochromatium glycolicum]